MNLEELQQARLSAVLGAFRGFAVYANARQDTEGTPRHRHINIHVEMLSGWDGKS